MRIGLPAERGVEAGEDVIVVRIGVNGVVQAIDDEVVLLDKVAFSLVDGIIAELGDVVAMVIEGWLVADDEVVAATDGLAEDVKGIEKGGGRCRVTGGCGIAAFEGVDGVRGGGCGRSGVWMRVQASAAVRGCCAWAAHGDAARKETPSSRRRRRVEMGGWHAAIVPRLDSVWTSTCCSAGS